MNPIQMRSRLRVWRRWGSLIICASVFVQWIIGSTETTFVVILSVISVIAVWFGWQGTVHLVQHLRLRLAGHVATATIKAYRKDEPFDERPYVPLVSFTTGAGEQRDLVPLTSRYEDPPQAAARVSDRGRTNGSHGDAPPIGHTLRVVYEPADPTWADERSNGPMLALSMICHLVMVAMFGALLIATVATQVPALRHS
jgi:hypothetical protein